MAPQRRVLVTTSWDDGNPADFRVAELLSKYGLTGTFYIPRVSEYSTMPENEIVSLGNGFEVGAHTINHAILTRTESSVARQEITESKQWLESLLGRPCSVFCFPQGRFNRDHLRMVEGAGFTGARTVELLSDRVSILESGMVLMPTTVQAMDHDRSAYLRNLTKRRSLSGLWSFVRSGATADWTRLARAQFDRAITRGEGVFHLWGHSWEMDEHDQWSQLGQVLAYIADHRSEVEIVSNGELCDKILSR